jgi:hypothetical protein
VSEYCANWELHPASAPRTRGWAPLSGRFSDWPYPGLKPWAILFCHFMANAFRANNTPTGPFAISLSTTSHNGTTRILSMRLSSALLFVFLNLTSGLASALSLNTVCLETKLRILAKNFNARVGVCVSDSRRGVSINGNRRFPLHSVFNLTVALTVLDARSRCVYRRIKRVR